MRDEETVSSEQRRRSDALHITDATANSVEKTAQEEKPMRRRAEKRLGRLEPAPPRFSQRPGELPQCACATMERWGRGEKPVPFIVTEPPRPSRRARTRAHVPLSHSHARAELAAQSLAHALGRRR